jgi:hypothetical protein
LFPSFATERTCSEESRSSSSNNRDSDDNSGRTMKMKNTSPYLLHWPLEAAKKAKNDCPERNSGELIT